MILYKKNFYSLFFFNFCFFRFGLRLRRRACFITGGEEPKTEARLARRLHRLLRCLRQSTIDEDSEEEASASFGRFFASFVNLRLTKEAKKKPKMQRRPKRNEIFISFRISNLSFIILGFQKRRNNIQF
jgi:hypothetical protein